MICVNNTVYVKLIRGGKLSRFITIRCLCRENFHGHEPCYLISINRSRLLGVHELEESRFYTCAMTEETREFVNGSFVRGYHVYQDIWT